MKIIYEKLFSAYGEQGWWPILDKRCKLSYHPGDYSPPNNRWEIFQVWVGSILAQNTTWKMASRALINLAKARALNPYSIIEMNHSKFSRLIKPAGFLNRKAKYLKEISKFFISLEGVPGRDELLSIKGVGDETADTILLYAYKIPEFIVDSYTRRILKRIKLIKGDENYMEIKKLFEDNLPSDYRIFQEYHALLVEHGKRYYQGKSARDPLLSDFYGSIH
ncbi:MAG TPA: endonuclease III domain-containing protein [Methanothermobacter sp.]|nr:endonuclease III domain-containing protein [Methanothermobacter sp.]HOK72687.1 endonuclease III domain-containing protein [Methanothermobacter sp.]HOL68593.1 endonuclease III domain-containing protein [Methanothermobacter sp.]HPQ04352.1 endonuclease III domain-containing protein [Methanothermobacter sp.]HPU36543.1 endonuclease III domain-containing protein [Methanothermobacter sp.]